MVWRPTQVYNGKTLYYQKGAFLMTKSPRLTKLWKRFVCVYVLLWWVEGNFVYISRGYFMSTDVIIHTDKNEWWLSLIIFYQISYTTYFDKKIKYILCPSLRLTFYTPVWKSIGCIIPWQWPSVRPSVCSSQFSDFFNMLWDINLKLAVYLQ